MVSACFFSFSSEEEVWEKFETKKIAEKTEEYMLQMKSAEIALISKVIEEMNNDDGE